MKLDDAEFQKRLAAAIKDMKSGAVKGMRLAAAHVKLESQKKTPVNVGFLKDSAYTSVSVGSNNVIGEIGFTAEYATWVHEAPMTLQGKLRPRLQPNNTYQGKYWDKQGQATNKFLEKALDENHSKILIIFQKAAKI